MKRLIRNFVLSAAVAATALAAVPSAHAGSRVDDKTAAMIGIGLFGIAAGVMIGGVLAGEHRSPQVDRNPRPRPHQDRNFFPAPPKQPVYGNGGHHYEDGPRYGRRHHRARY